MPEAFGERLAAVFDSAGHLCVGIDPHASLLDSWGLPDTADGVREFGLRVVDAAAGTVGIVKPQVAFFERHGSAGYAALELVLAAARSAGLLVIADAKRGDIGSTIDAYAGAWLSPGSPLEADAMTAVAYQGVGSLEGPIALARAGGKGVFVLAATSNPEAVAVQTSVIGGGKFSGLSVAAGIVGEVDVLNRYPSRRLGSVGVVIGATVGLADYGISVETDLDAIRLARTPILAPGFGEQGALFDDLRSSYGWASDNVIASVSRGILRAGPSAIASEIATQATALRLAFAT